MPKGLTFLPSLALAALVAMPLTAETKPDADTVVATVNGDEITLGHMIVARSVLPEQYQQLPDQVLYDAILDQLVQQSLLTQAHVGDMPKRIELAMENERRSLLASEMLNSIVADAVTEAALQAAYDEKYADGFGGEEFNASHILVASRGEAEEIKAQLDDGADFAALAKEKSTGPSGPNGGALGWFGLGAMVPAFEEAVLKLNPGEVSEPVQTQFGWHVLILNEKRKSEAPELKDVQPELETQIQQDAIDAHIAKLTKEGNIVRAQIGSIKPEALRAQDLLQE